MFPVIVAHDTILLPITHDQSFLLKLIAVSESNESSLSKAEEIDPVKIMLQLKGQMFLLILILIKILQVLIVQGRVLSLDHVTKLGCLLLRGQS